jgi:membrane-associated phospholipid phosphatase
VRLLESPLRFVLATGSSLAVLLVTLFPRLAWSRDTAPLSRNEPLRLAPGALAPVVYPETALRFGIVDGVLTGLGGATALTAALIGPDRDNGPRGGWWFDEDVRDALRPEDFNAQLAFRDTSDVLLGFSLAYAFLGDPLIHVTWLRKSPDVARQMAFLNAEVAAIAFGVSQLTANVVSRERPYGRTCGTPELDERSSQCTTNDRYLSHFSGHATLTFAMAAVTCAHHNALGLSGGHSWIPCLTGFTAAGATAAFRIAGDMHYATDVLTGAAIGTLVGFAVPAVHYGFGRYRPRASTTGGHVSVVPTFGGLSVSGVW